MTVLEAGGKTATKEVEVLSPKSTEKEIRSAMQDEDNRLVYVLENRTSLLTSIFPSVKVEYGFVLAVHPDERYACTLVTEFAGTLRKSFIVQDMRHSTWPLGICHPRYFDSPKYRICRHSNYFKIRHWRGYVCTRRQSRAQHSGMHCKV